MSILVRWALDRPVALTAVVLLVAGMAMTSFQRLPIALLPSLDYPSLLVFTAAPQSSPVLIEQQVTEPLESALAGLAGVRNLDSVSRHDGSVVRVDFAWDVDLAASRLEMREQLDRARGQLPDDVGRPVILHLDPSERPIMVLALRPRYGGVPDSDLAETARQMIARRLEQLPGVARVRVSGASSRHLEVRVRPDLLAFHGLTLGDVRTALADAAVETSAGTVREGHVHLAVEVRSQLHGSASISALALGLQNGLRLDDVATIYETDTARRGTVRVDGQPSLLLSVDRSQQANTLETAEAVHTELCHLTQELADVQFDVLMDESRFVHAAVVGVGQAILLGAVLALLVLLLFSRRPRSLIALAASVPLSLLLTMVLFDALGITLNLVSLGGLALGVGLLVDNAIVVVENITRHRQKGTPDPSRVGAVEVAPAITASTLTTLVVFLPLSFSGDLAGRLLRDQGLAVACSLLASLLVALTVVPVLARERLGTPPVAKPQPLPNAPASGLGRLSGVYSHALTAALHRPGRPVAAALLLLLVAAGVAATLPREVVPEATREQLAVRLALPPATPFAALDASAQRLEHRLIGVPGVKTVVADLGERDDAGLELEPRPANEGELRVLVEADAASTVRRTIHRHLSAMGIDGEVAAVRSRLETLIRGPRHDLAVEILGVEDSWGPEAEDALASAVKESPWFDSAYFSGAERFFAYRLRLQTEAMARYGLRADAVAEHLRAAAGRRGVGTLRTAGGRLPIDITVPAGSLEGLLQQPVATRHGPRALGLFVESERVNVRAERFRVQRLPVRKLLVETRHTDPTVIAPALGAVVSRHLRPPASARVVGANESFRRIRSAVTQSLILSAGLIYLLLAAHFESFLTPLVVLAAVPLAAAGVFPALALCGESLNLMSLVGCVVLVGIVVNDAIIKVDLIQQRRRAGVALVTAVSSASHDRMRPILMTTTTTVFGLLPMAALSGQGAELRSPLAVALVGGLLGATVLTLFVIPALYLLMEKGRQGLGRRFDKGFPFSDGD